MLTGVTGRLGRNLVVVVAALLAALAGTAVAGSDVRGKAVSKKKVKKIADKEINKLAPGLHVASADSATSADNAANADNAENATSADNAAALGGKGVGSFGSGPVFGSTLAIPAGSGQTFRSPYGVTDAGVGSGQDAVAPVAMKLRSFRARSDNVTGVGESIEIGVEVSPPGGISPLCTVSAASENCTAAGPISIPAGSGFHLRLLRASLDGSETIDYGYRLVP